MNRQSQILGHDAVFLDSVDTSLFKVFTESGQLRVTVQFSTVGKTAGPGEDGGNRVGAA